MEAQHLSLISILNELVEIHNERIIGYEKAATETVEQDLKLLFAKLTSESREYRVELGNIITAMDGTITEGETSAGKFYHVWAGVKGALATLDRKTILEFSEKAEDTTLEHYEDALMSPVEMSAETRQVIAKQKQLLKHSHDSIKALRDNTNVQSNEMPTEIID